MKNEMIDVIERMVLTARTGKMVLIEKMVLTARMGKMVLMARTERMGKTANQ